ncbi:MAG: hypothetical protein ACYDER_02880 [Ktedonobacteraceae bacterium]
MSDFFTRLAERTLGLAPTIQPITPSLFAPDPDLPGDMLLEISEENEESIAADNFISNAESPVLAQDAVAHLTYPTLLTHPASIPEQHEVSQPFSTTSLATARQVDRLTTYRETLATGVKVQPTRRGSQRTQRVTPALSTYTQTPSFAPMNAQTLRMAQRSGEITEPTPTFLTSSATDNPFTHIAHVSTMQATSEQQLAQVQQTTRSATPHERIVSQHTLVGVPASNPLSTADFWQTKQTQQPQPEMKSPEPDIQVTIGRVEVRAVTAPPTSAHTHQQSDRPPAMSLDEYLRQQERGRGRR